MQSMENTYNFEPAHFSVGHQSYAVVDLPALCGDKLQQLPVVLRLLLENAVRNMKDEERLLAVQSIFDWLDTGTRS